MADMIFARQSGHKGLWTIPGEVAGDYEPFRRRWLMQLGLASRPWTEEEKVFPRVAASDPLIPVSSARSPRPAEREAPVWPVLSGCQRTTQVDSAPTPDRGSKSGLTHKIWEVRVTARNPLREPISRRQ
jgi:hypothetical protein